MGFISIGELEVVKMGFDLIKLGRIAEEDGLNTFMLFGVMMIVWNEWVGKCNGCKREERK